MKLVIVFAWFLHRSLLAQIIICFSRN